MTSGAAAEARTIAAEHMRPGDHAFACYDDGDTRWETLGVFARVGLTRHEKVTVFPDLAVPEETVLDRLAGHGPLVERAWESGQLTVSSMRALISPDSRFTPERQMGRLREETDTAIRQGYSAFRTIIDMAWVQDLDADHATVAYRESHAQALFADSRYSEICTYDRRRFDSGTLQAMRQAHPRNLLGRVGELRAEATADGLRLIGDADLATWADFTAAVRSALTGPADTEAVTLDLSGLCFLDIGCASTLLRKVARSTCCKRVDVHCQPNQATLLRRLGAGTIAHLVITEAAIPRPDRVSTSQTIPRSTSRSPSPISPDSA